MNLKFLKKTFISSLVIGMVSLNFAHANTPVPQKAYYDTFSFKVNGMVQYINDITKKPFIANSRVYVPISTLGDLGIASVQWIPSGGAGMQAELRITPVASQSEDKSSYYEQKINELSTEIAKKDGKIKELEESMKKLTEENNSLKSKKKSEEKPNYDDRDVRRQISDLEYDLGKDRNFNRININGKVFDVKYSISYRRMFDVSMYIKGLSTSDLERIKDSNRDVRNIETLAEDVAREINRIDNFKNIDINITVYDSASNDREIGDFTYKEGKFRGDVRIR